MSTLELQSNSYLSVTPKGAYHCVSSPSKSLVKSLLKWILEQQSSPLISEELFEYLTVDDLSPEALKDLVSQAIERRWVEAVDDKIPSISGALEEVLPSILPTLSSEGKVLLADAQGFNICASGFNQESAERLSALSADIASLHDRHLTILQESIGQGLNAWGMIDAAGKSRIGFWPMFIGGHRFVLMIAGLPKLNQKNLTKIISILSIRYG